MTYVLYISYDGMTDPLGQSQVLPYIIGLSKKGYNFHLISFEKQDRYTSSKKDIEEICHSNNINWHPLSYTKNPPLLSTIKDVYRLNRYATDLHKRYKFSIIHCRSYISSLVGVNLKKKFGIKFIFDMRGFWADERVDGKIWNLKNPIYKIVFNYFKRKEIQFFNEADQIISLTHAGKKEILKSQKINIKENKITVIPCCSDLQIFNEKMIDLNKSEEFKINNNLMNKKILGYVGSIGTWYLLDEMLAFFKIQKEKHNNLHFLFITKDDASGIFSKAEALAIPKSDISIISSSRQDMPTYISLFNCSIFFIKPCFSKLASSPTKQGELMSMGIPLIVNDGVGDTSFIVEKYRAGITLNNFSEDTFRQTNLEFSDFNKLTTQKGSEEFYGLHNGVENYHTVYSEVLQ